LGGEVGEIGGADVNEHGNVAAGKRNDHVIFLQARQALDGIRLGIKAMPDAVPLVFVILG